MARNSTPSLAGRIAALEHELEALRRLEALAGTIATIIGPGVLFSARELFEYRLVSPELEAALEAAGIHNARQLGKRLRQACGAGLARVGADEHGAIWMVAESAGALP